MTSVVKPCVTVPAAWAEGAMLVARWLSDRDRVDQLLERLPATLTSVERARCQHLVFGVVRHAGRLEAAIDRLIAHPPRFVTRAVIFVAGFELLESGPSGPTPKIVHHAVDQARALASPAEARLVNAVLRRLASELHSQAAPARFATAEALAQYYSHPVWLVRRWLVQHGAEATRALLEWNQRPAPIYARVRKGAQASPPAATFLKPTQWPGFFEVPSGRWPEVERMLNDRLIYLQDPVARIPVELLDPRPGESILDVCAAPGGKTLLIADRLAAAGRPGETAGSQVVAMDLPGERIGRLRENLATVAGVNVALVEGDALHGAARLLAAKKLPVAYPGVLVDVPCSNTGVMRHRVDVKWRLQEADFRRHARQQLALLAACARLVAPGGRLVYSTCSVDLEENEGVVKEFLRDASGRFTLEAREISYPWVTGHDGAGAFSFRHARSAETRRDAASTTEPNPRP